jgi:hypothetical protein
MERYNKIISLLNTLMHQPSIELFNELVSIVEKDDFQAGLSPNKKILPTSDILYLAFLKKGIKPIVWIYGCILKDKYKILYNDMKYIEINYNNIQKCIIIYNNLEHANKFISFLNFKSKLSFYHPKIDEEMGKLLGYSKHDIDFFIKRNYKTYGLPDSLQKDIIKKISQQMPQVGGEMMTG